MEKTRERIFAILLMGLIIIQPILDLKWLNDGSIGEVFGFTIPTLVRVGLTAIIGLLSFFVIKIEKKHMAIAGYIGAIVIYFIFHHINAQNFYSLVPNNGGYNIVGELFYIVRMCIPLAVMYFVYNSKFDNKMFKICIVTVVALISLIAVGTNLTKTAIGSYYEIPIAGSIIDWFTHPGEFTHRQLASKGWFYNSIISMVLVLLLPYLYWLFIQTKKLRYMFLVALQSVALFMFGTKASSYSVIIIAVLMTGMYCFFSVICKHYKFDIKLGFMLLLLIIFSCFILKNSPNTVRTDFEIVYEENIDENENLLVDTEDSTEDSYFDLDLTDEEIIAFFDENYHYIAISEVFLVDSYSYKYDPQFWARIYTQYVPSQTMQNRFIQEQILERVKEINDNRLDELLGIGYTRTSSIFNLEKDFVYQYYSMGLIGALLLVGPYIAILGVVIINILMNFKKKCTLDKCALILGCGLTCCLAYFSGNTLETLGITIILGMVYGYLLKINFKSE